MRFIHTADWQLGKPFGGFADRPRADLTTARFDAIDTIGTLAAKANAAHVLVAGDIFDTEGPDDRTIVQAVSRMKRSACHWWLLPGNHDFARNGGLWDRVRQRIGSGADARITILSEAAPHHMGDDVWLLPAPLDYRHNSADPTAAFDAMDTPGAKLRIGIAHGSIRDFGSRGETNNLIPPDRASRSALDYLALGDWHGTLNIGERTWYSGTPETDRFQRDEPGQCLVVDLKPGAAPAVEAVRTGKYQWLQREWTVDDFAGFARRIDALLAECDPAATLVRLKLEGMVTMHDRVAIRNRIEDDLIHRLHHFERRDGGLLARPTDDDLAALEAEGMLGHAAASLRDTIEDGGTQAPVARQALERLFVEISRAENAA